MGSDPTGLTRALLLVAAAVSFAVFLGLAAVFWIGTNTTRAADTSGSAWSRALGDVGGWKVLPLVTLACIVALALARHRSAATFLVLAVGGAGALMYASRIVLQALGADDDGGRLSDYPSGHTAAGAALLGALTALVFQASRNAAVRAVAAGAATAGVAAMGWARVNGGDHSVLDVAGGATLAVGWLAVSLLLVPPDDTRSLSRAHVVYAVLAVGVAGFVFLAVLYDNDPLATIDRDVAERVADDTPGWAEWLARPFSWLGGWIGLTALVVAISVMLLRARAWLDLAFFLTAFLGSQLVVSLLKEGFDRPRPHAGSAVPLPDSAAFPSGHATAGVASLGAAVVLVTERLPSQRARAWFWSAMIALGSGVGLSRIVLNVHFVTDVLAGWCLGLAWLAACLLVRDLLRESSSDPALPR